MILTVGTRGSKLSLIQTKTVLDSLKFVHPELEFKVKVIKTLGDKERKKPLFTIDRKGIFEKEIDLAIVRGEIDFAVHSLKDVPIVESLETIMAAIPKRSSPHDVLISKGKILFDVLAKGAVIGTGSLRRMAQIKFLRPDLEVRPIRGNVETRIAKVNRGEFDGIVLAEAGLDRMGLESLIAERFSLDRFTPAAGQGALAIVVRKDDEDFMKLLRSIDHPPTRAEVTAERSLVLSLKGGCRVPIGAIGRADDRTLSLYSCIFSISGQKKISSFAKGSLDEAEDLGRKVAQSLMEQGAKDFEAEWREKYGSW
ncbi:MAG: hydroxymethylbilane synthase [archaeon]|nr:hydroxymethylbilane synthase [archaeon]MCP8313391.1 hydroxymethylbilane synthase [archaeon]MCP8316443.1 hydroxymethylbilane synthase [archaeon]MCP8322544.1 hydroxymethylbilane synthase [archaeon]